MAATAALQNGCGSNFRANVTAGAVAGYLGPAPCSRYYGYTWWIVWFLFFVLVLVPCLLVMDGIRSFRAGTLALLALVTMLVGDTANTYFAGKHLNLRSTIEDRTNTLLAGSIIASVGLYCMIIVLGIVDEKQETRKPTGEPTGETYGGRYQSQPEQTEYTSNPTFDTGT